MEGCSEIYFKPVHGALQKKLFQYTETTNKAKFLNNVRKTRTTFSTTDEETVSEKYFPSGSGVPSLYSQCMELLSNFTHLFESLVDFPKDFALEILKKAEDKLLTDCDDTVTTIGIYQEAYPDDFLPEVSLVNALYLINNYEKCLPALLSNVVRLEICDSYIDDDHDIIEVILDIISLKELSLSGNLLTDQGIKRLVLPALSRQKRRLAKLSLLDVSFNKLDRKAIARVKLLPGVDSIIVGEADLKDSESLFLPSFVKRGCPRFSSFSTCGFGKSLLLKWTKEMEKRLERNKLRESWNNFYSRQGRKTPTRKVLTNMPSELIRNRTNNKILFRRVKKNLSEPIKRKNEIESCGDNSLKAKKPKLGDGCSDSDLLKLYS